MSKIKSIYICKECGKFSPKWLGKCPDCSAWNSFEEKIVEKTVSSQGISSFNGNPTKLVDIDVLNDRRIITGDKEFDRVLGGGIVIDSVNILSAPPGAGKSTLLLGIANRLAKKGINVLYASGEESESQIKSRANRILKDDISENLYVISDPYKRLETIIEIDKVIDAKLIIIDSIQTFTLDRCLPSRAGSPTQVKECASEIVTLCKNKDNPKCSIIIGQMVKNDEIAGPRTLEHLVDAVFVLEGDNFDEMRLLYSNKNRFGTPEVGIYRMVEEGMIPVSNPSEAFITKRENGEAVVGSAITIIKEGSRPIAVEIESLISKSFTPYPTRLGEGIRKDQLNILISILEQRGAQNLYDKNVIVKATGNLKLQESSVGLAIVMSITSSIYRIPISPDIVFIAELGLTGELKKAQNIEQKIKEAERMGFKTIIIPSQQVKTDSKIKILKMKDLVSVIKYIFNK